MEGVRLQDAVVDVGRGGAVRCSERRRDLAAHGDDVARQAADGAQEARRGFAVRHEDHSAEVATGAQQAERRDEPIGDVAEQQRLEGAVASRLPADGDRGKKAGRQAGAAAVDRNDPDRDARPGSVREERFGGFPPGGV